MDTIEIIIENIESQDIDSICKLVDYFIKEGSKKHLLLSELITLFSGKYINTNLWLLREFSKLISNIEKLNGKNKLELEMNLKQPCILLAYQEIKDLSLYKKGISQDLKYKIETLISSSYKEYSDLHEFKEDVHYECYSLLNVFYDNIAHASSLNDIFSILRYFIDTKKKILLISDRFSDIIDLLFIIIIKYIENNRLPEDVKEYVILCKDLFYYRSKQKDKLIRINLLFYSLYILVKRQTKFQQIEYKTNIVSQTKSKNKLVDYLYVVIPLDVNIMNIVKNERELNKVFKKPEKLINIKSIVKTPSQNNNINIIKI